MFGLGMWEILIILALALIFIGPKKLPDLARNLGRGLREFRNAANEIRVDFQRVDDEAEAKKKNAVLPHNYADPAAAKQPDSAAEKSSDKNDGGHA